MRTLPLFPLQVVVFPRERIRLHIFEERYKQLISDCENNGLSFGIPTVLEGKMSYGTEIRLLKIVKRYENGTSDILCEGGNIFKIEDFYNPMPDKLYSGGNVIFVDHINDSVDSLKDKVLKLIREFYELLDLSPPEIEYDQFTSFTLAHKLGFSLAQEYELLQLIYESERLNFIKDHLRTVIPIITEVNRTKKIIGLNGHFRRFDPMDFTDINNE